MIAASAQSFIPPFPQSAIRLPSRKTVWQHAVAQADLPFHTKGILLIVAAEWMDADGGSCHPSEEQIMAKAGISRPCLTRHLRIAVERGFIERWRFGHGPQNRRYNYRATFPGDPARPAATGNAVSYPPAAMGNAVSHLNHVQALNHPERAREPEPAGPAIAAPSPEALRTAKTGAPDGVPAAWLDQAGSLRPDLTPEQIKASAEVFLDHHRAKGTQLVDWLPAWRNWIRRERAPRAATPARTATPVPSRYPTPEQRLAPLPAIVQAAMAASEQRRIAQLLAEGIDPATGLRGGARRQPGGPAVG